MRVLGIDPGYAIVGWGVVDYQGNRFSPVGFGAVTTAAGVDFEKRLEQVYQGVKEVFETYRPEALSIEKLFYQHNQTTVIGVAGRSRSGFCLAIAASFHLVILPLKTLATVAASMRTCLPASDTPRRRNTIASGEM